MNIKFRNFLGKSLGFAMSMFFKIEKKIYFTALVPNQYSDSTRAITERMHKLYPDYTLIWDLRNYKDKYNIIPDYIQIPKTFVHYRLDTERHQNLNNCKSRYNMSFHLK